VSAPKYVGRYGAALCFRCDTFDQVRAVFPGASVLSSPPGIYVKCDGWYVRAGLQFGIPSTLAENASRIDPRVASVLRGRRERYKVARVTCGVRTDAAAFKALCKPSRRRRYARIVNALAGAAMFFDVAIGICALRASSVAWGTRGAETVEVARRALEAAVDLMRWEGGSLGVEMVRVLLGAEPLDLVTEFDGDDLAVLELDLSKARSLVAEAM
jgi:hypothetical protein